MRSRGGSNSSVREAVAALSAAALSNPEFDNASETPLFSTDEQPLISIAAQTIIAITDFFCLNLTTGSYQWDENGISSSSHADPISLADGTSDVTVVNTSMLAGNPRPLQTFSLIKPPNIILYK